jgi:hypothetical protein
MQVPHEQIRGSASKIFLIRRAHVLRASLEKSELSPSSWVLVPASELSASAQPLELSVRVPAGGGFDEIRREPLRRVPAG